MFISPTTHQARSVPRSQRSRAQYTHAAIIAASSRPATTLDAWPSIAACRPAELNASTAHARRPKTGPPRKLGTDISLLTQVQTHRTRDTHPCRSRFFNPRSKGGVCRALQSEELYGLLAHLDLADLAGDCHREFLDDVDVARDLVVGQLSVRELADGIRVERTSSRLHPDPGTDFLAVPLVRHADHLSVLDVRVGVQKLLDLAGINVLPAADHHVLDASDDVAVAVRPHDRQVAGAQPPVSVDRLARLLLVLPIAEHHRVSARAELAGLAAFDDGAGSRVDDLDLHVRMSPADGGGTPLEVVVDTGLAGRGRCLGH